MQSQRRQQAEIRSPERPCRPDLGPARGKAKPLIALIVGIVGAPIVMLAGLTSNQALAQVPGAPPPSGVGVGVWNNVEPMGTGRSFYTATLLPDGAVLVAGGCVAYGPIGCSQATDSTEIFNPAKNRWSKGPAMKAARFEHTATALPDGRVLVTGGCAEGGGGQFSCGRILSSTEIYDPKAKSWKPAADMNSARSRHTAALIPLGGPALCGNNCGNVFVLGDSIDRYGAGARAVSPEIFDVGAGQWRKTADPSSSDTRNAGGDCCTPIATALANGTILMTGLIDPPSPLFNTKTETWSVPPAPGLLRIFTSATKLDGRRVLVTGGYAPNQPGAQLATAEIFDSGNGLESKGAWAPTGRMITGRQAHTATLLRDGRVLLAGGGQDPTGQAEIYDPPSGQFTKAAEMNQRRGGDPASRRGESRVFHNNPGTDFTSTLLRDGRVLVAGGGVNTGVASKALPGQTQMAALRAAETFSPPGLAPVNQGEGLTHASGNGHSPGRMRLLVSVLAGVGLLLLFVVLKRIRKGRT